MAAGLGPSWPDARVLANLQQQCIALSYEACQHSSQGVSVLTHAQLTPTGLTMPYLLVDFSTNQSAIWQSAEDTICHCTVTESMG